MKRKIFIIGSVIFVLLVGYLFLAHHLIYKQIGAAGLKASDIKGEYVIGSEKNGTGLIYTALGDSLTAGVGVVKYEDSYPYQIAQKFAADDNKIILHDRAYPGARTADLVKDLLASAINDKPDIITLLIGVNDIHGNVLKTTFANNYKEILKRLKIETKAQIYAISIPYIGTEALLLPPYNLYFRYETIEYNKIIKRLAAENNIEYVDLYSPTEKMFKDPTLYASDSFHPSAQGYLIWADIIYAHLNKRTITFYENIYRDLCHCLTRVAAAEKRSGIISARFDAGT